MIVEAEARPRTCPLEWPFPGAVLYRHDRMTGMEVEMPERIHREHMVRAARNQALFREVNESVREVNETFGEIEPTAEWVCECAHPTCVERITLTIDEYKALRAAPSLFAVAPSEGHVFVEVENIVDRTERYWVVEKIGEAAEFVAAVAPQQDRA